MSLHQRNLRTIAFLKDFETVYLQKQNCEIKINKSYVRRFQSDYPLENIINTYRVSFNHYLVLLNLPRFDLSQSSVDLNQFLDFEYRSYILTLLKKSLDGLARLRKYYVYYRKNDEVHLINSTIDYYTPILWEIEINLKDIKKHMSPASPEIEEKVRNYLKELSDLVFQRENENCDQEINTGDEMEGSSQEVKSGDEEDSDDEGLCVNFKVTRVVAEDEQPTFLRRIANGLIIVKNSISTFCRRCFMWVVNLF